MNVTAIFLFFLTFSTYLSTLCPFIYWKDAGEITSAVASLGICHPSGYPVYSMLGFFSGLLPFGDMAFRLNLLSAIPGACVSVAVFYFLKRMHLTLTASIAGALLVSFAHEIWLESIVNEIYSLSLFLIVLVLVFVSGKKSTDFYIACFILGLAVAHHLTTILLIPSIIFLGLHHLDKLDMKKISIGIVLCLFAASSLIYLPVRAHQNPAANFGDPDSFVDLKDHYLTKHYSSKMWPDRLEPIQKRIVIITQLMIKQFGLGIFFLSIIGFYFGFSQGRWRWFLLFFVGAHGAFLLYPPDHSFLIPLIFLTGCMGALCCDQIIRFSNNRFSIGSWLGVCVNGLLLVGLPTILFAQNYALLKR